MNVHAVVEALLKARLLKKAVLPFPYRGDTRYLLGDVDLLDLVQSLNQEGYFTHFTAIFLNDLTEQTPKTVYFNIEQRLTGGDGQMTQEALNRAFKAQPRLSSNIVEYKGTRIVKVNGRNTHQLGVVAKNRSHAGALRITDMERTLIDATVRPVYSGGIAVVAKAFELAKRPFRSRNSLPTCENCTTSTPITKPSAFIWRGPATTNDCSSCWRIFPSSTIFICNTPCGRPCSTSAGVFTCPRDFSEEMGVYL